MGEQNEYVYKLEVNWSLLTEGLTLSVENQVVFGRIMDRYLAKGENKPIKIYLNGKSYDAKVVNVNYSNKYQRKHDVLQIRYPKNGELACELQRVFFASYNFFVNARKMRPEGSRSMPKLPEEAKEYLAIYTTEYDDTYEFETIETTDMDDLKQDVVGKSEYAYELDYILDMKDGTSTCIEVQRTSKIRKLNRKIGDNLKLLYGYRCQICGCLIGEEYGSHIAEAHHIEYFVKSLNNDASNQMILCPNHHRIIHDTNPVFQRHRLMYVYENGFEETLRLNHHL
ncbi:MAG: HNH endonuclease signature motif containing protein [Lachnospiraceae bacterium]|nr:HNH endonuclease signature motif containing protein [Lachnospiraceae bacterium]MDD3617736.1 HNH endonuclease signature motif containing protein [Lachnospiraceae bacterium]